jgi:mannonate dehydratase
MSNYLDGWGKTMNQGKLWSYDELSRLKNQIESHGLTLEAIENFDPSHWYDVLLDGPKKDEQLEGLKQMIRAVGKAGIPIIGYYFSLAGVWGWTPTENGRGNARSVEFDASSIDLDRPIPGGMVWNMIYESQVNDSITVHTSPEEVWQRYQYFLNNILPVAEEEGVRLVAHPDDPPLPELRNTARLFYSHETYERSVTEFASHAHGMEFCLGTLQEMKDGDVYELLDKHASQGNIGYIHFRNVRGKVPHYREVFVDEGDLDMVRVLRILKKHNYNGVIIPDHTPEIMCNAPWHAGMAYALGYIKGAMQALEI